MLNVATYGQRHYPCLVCLHGFMGSLFDFEPLCQRLSKDFFCVAIDLPGFGGSSMIQPLTFFSIIKEIQTTLHHLSIPSFHMIGYSMGGRIALEYFNLHETDCQSLILLSTRLEVANRQQRAAQTHHWIQILRNYTFKDFLLKWYAQALFSTLSPSIINKRIHNDPNILIEYLQNLCPSKQKSWVNRLQRLKKGLFFFGEKDTGYHLMYNEHRKRLDHLHFVEIDGASHALLEENHQQVAIEINHFMETL